MEVWTLKTSGSSTGKMSTRGPLWALRTSLLLEGGGGWEIAIHSTATHQSVSLVGQGSMSLFLFLLPLTLSPTPRSHAELEK